MAPGRVRRAWTSTSQTISQQWAYSPRDPNDIPLREELLILAAERGIRLHLIAGNRGELGIGHDPLGPDGLRKLVPDAADRDVYMCGPNPLMERARAALLTLGADPARINLELFG